MTDAPCEDGFFPLASRSRYPVGIHSMQYPMWLEDHMRECRARCLKCSACLAVMEGAGEVRDGARNEKAPHGAGLCGPGGEADEADEPVQSKGRGRGV